jgi:hypothetical protein
MLSSRSSDRQRWSTDIAIGVHRPLMARGCLSSVDAASASTRRLFTSSDRSPRRRSPALIEAHAAKRRSMAFARCGQPVTVAPATIWAEEERSWVGRIADRGLGLSPVTIFSDIYGVGCQLGKVGGGRIDGIDGLGQMDPSAFAIDTYRGQGGCVVDQPRCEQLVGIEVASLSVVAPMSYHIKSSNHLIARAQWGRDHSDLVAAGASRCVAQCPPRPILT